MNVDNIFELFSLLYIWLIVSILYTKDGSKLLLLLLFDRDYPTNKKLAALGFFFSLWNYETNCGKDSFFFWQNGKDYLCSEHGQNNRIKIFYLKMI